MKISDATSEDVAYVATRMRERDAQEFLALSHFPDRGALAKSLIERFGDGKAICAFLEEEPVAIGALVELRPNVVSLMFFSTDKFPAVAMALTRFIRERLLPEYQAAGVHRIECLSLERHTDAHRWIKTLGLRLEGSFVGYGKSRETYHQFAWVSDVCSTGD